jgi:hypothetical protein
VAEALGLPGAPRAPPPIRATSITSLQCRHAQLSFGPLSPSELEGEGSSRGPSGLPGCLCPPSHAAAAVVHVPTTTVVRFSHLAPRGGGGKGEKVRPISLPGCPSRHRRLTDRSHLAIIAVRREEGNGEVRATEASGLPGRPFALHHSTPPSTRSRRARHITTTAGAKRGKEEQPRPLGLPGCPRDAATATPPSRWSTPSRAHHLHHWIWPPSSMHQR